MAKKKTEETVEAVESAAVEEVAVSETVEAAASADTEIEAVSAEVAAASEERLKKAARSGKAKKSAETASEGSAATSATTASKGKRAEKIGVVSSDKMTKTVVVRVDRLVKHPIYRKYVRRRKKFMAHDELGAKIGDKVKIVETRPLSARKRWRVVEIIQKAEL
ncbi:MAG TPA: 30S ribosomal protein S17 [Blastocatellia bacterium]|nr:30S ribosomal protein S17 [Blastocatellia bacterium]